jgi:hypothetical protein
VGGEKWRAGSQALFAKAERGRIGQLPGDLALLGKFSAIEGTSVRGKFARSRGGPEADLGPLVQRRGQPRARGNGVGDRRCPAGSRVGLCATARTLARCFPAGAAAP